MKVHGDATWRVWWCCMMTMAAVVVLPMPSLAMEDVESEVGQKLSDTTVTFDISNIDNAGYSRFLDDYRKAVAAPTLACGLQSTSSSPNYVYVKLTISSTEWVTVGIATTDLYVWGYQDNKIYDKKLRARFFKDVPVSAYNNLFGGSDKQKTNLESNYNRLVPRTDFNRDKLDLKLKTLQDAVKGVYGKTAAELNKGKSEANFFFIMAQMVSEAARFQFMEKAILAYNTKPLSSKMIAFQSNWDAISFAIHTAAAAKPPCQKFEPILKVGSDYTFNNVNEIKGEMGILKFKKNKSKPQKFEEEVLLAEETFLGSAFM